MYIKPLFLFLTLMFCLNSYGEKTFCNVNDSIKYSKEFNVIMTKVNQLNDSSTYYSTLDPVKSYMLADSAYKISSAIDYCKGRLESVYNMGVALFSKGEIEKSQNIFDITIKAAEILRTWELRGKANLQKAKIELNAGNFVLCLEYCFQSLKDFYRTKDFHGMAKAYIVIGIAYAKNNSFNRALSFNEKAYSILSAINEKNDLSLVINNNAIIYVQQGYLELGLKSFYEVLNLSISENQFSNQALYNLNIGKIYMIKEEYKLAEKYLKRSLDINKKYNFYQGLVLSHSNLGDLYYSLKDYELSLYHLKQSELISSQFGLTAELLIVYERLAKVYEQKNDHSRALKYYKANNYLNDSLRRANPSSDLYLVEEKFQNEINKNLLEMQRRDNEILRLKVYENSFFKFLLITLLSVFLLVFMILTYVLRVRKKTNKKLLELNAALLLANQKFLETEAELRESNATKDKFFSLISHDLRNPFATLISFVRIMKRDYASMSKEEFFELLNDLQISTDSAQELLENLLLWSRTQTGNIKFKPQVFNVFDVIQEVNSLFTGVLKSKELELKIYANKDQLIKADKNMISTIFRNLIQNAIKYSLPKNIVEVKVEVIDGFYVFAVKDSGVGMTEEVRKQLFKSGTSNTRRGTNDEKGTGIGLLICKEFVNFHNGNIEVESQLNKGTTITVKIPIV